MGEGEVENDLNADYQEYIECGLFNKECNVGMPFIEEIRYELMDKIHDVLYKMLSSDRNEPELVAKFIQNIVYEFDNYCHGNIFFHVGGVFIHQQPKVTSKVFHGTSPESVELGDVLLIRTYIEDDCVIERRAILLQVKKTKNTPIVKPDNEKQHRLYADWPEFTYVRSTRELNGQARHIADADIHNAAKYLLVCKKEKCHGKNCSLYMECISCFFAQPERCFPCRAVMSARPTFPYLSHYYCFATELFEFINGDAGKAFLEKITPSNIGWDRVIHDLLETTANQKSKLMRRKSGRSERGEGFWGTTYRQSMLHDIAKYSGNGIDDNQAAERFPDEGGISVIEFSIRTTTEQER